MRDMPPLQHAFADSYEPTGPFGAKGLGELNMDPTAAVINNAIFDAVGVRVKTLPITPEKILRARFEEETRQSTKIVTEMHCHFDRRRNFLILAFARDDMLTRVKSTNSKVIDYFRILVPSYELRGEETFPHDGENMIRFDYQEPTTSRKLSA